MAVKSITSTKFLRIASLNCKHFHSSGPKFDFMCDSYKDHDFVLLQELCLYASQLHKLKQLGGAADVTGNSSMDESRPLEGRPYGGCAIVYKTSLNCHIRAITSNHIRLCGVMVAINEVCELLILNAYMPCDTKTLDGNYDVFVDVLGEVDRLIQIHNPTYFCFGGDLNTDLSRSSPQTMYLKSFMDAHNMVTCIDLPVADVPYTYICHSGTSRIDHLLVSSELVSNVTSCYYIDGHLHSDHLPMVATVDLDVSHVKLCERMPTERINWSRASEKQLNHYTNDLDALLKYIDIDEDVLCCKDIHCTSHFDEICQFYQSILDCCIKASECIPRPSGSANNTRGKTSKSIPGWPEHVEPLRREALIWHNHWKSCGKPHGGLEAELRRITRARYHRAVRLVIREQDEIRMERMAKAILQSNHGDLWKEVKKIKGRGNIVAANIDGLSDENYIADLLYERYNSVTFDHTGMHHIVNEINARLVGENCIYDIELNDVTTASAHLKLGKSDGEEGLNSDHIIQGWTVTEVFNLCF